MLPSIDAKQRTELAHDGILVLPTHQQTPSLFEPMGSKGTHGISLDLDASSLCVLHQPCPSTTLDTGQGGIELLLEGFQTTIAVVDGFCELARWWLAATLLARRQVLPEERVVDVTACYACFVSHALLCQTLLDVQAVRGKKITREMLGDAPPWKLISGCSAI